MDALALTIAVVLFTLAVLHLYWAFGGMWPGRDGEELARLVVGGPIGLRMPSAAACVAVAVVLFVAAGLVLAAQGLLALPISMAWARVATFGVAGVLSVRGLGGFFETRLRPVILGTPYARLNVIAYSPLSLALGLSAFALVV
jgi:hypothetical protein